MTTISSENRFTVRTPGNEAIFGAFEGSTARDRMIWGSSRSFMMHLSDRQHQESLTLRRVFGLRCFCLPIRCQKLEVWMPPGILLGTVKEKFSLLTREFVIENEQSQVLIRMSIPFRSSLCMPKESHFRVKILICAFPNNLLNFILNFFSKGHVTRSHSTICYNYSLMEYRLVSLYNKHLFCRFNNGC